jgi:hypothetical protein
MNTLPHTRCALWKNAGTVCLFACLVSWLAGPGKATPVPQANGLVRSGRLSSHFAVADFDGDSKPDLATVQVGQITASRARYWILLEMSAGVRQFIGVTAPVGGLEIAPRDVNGDNSLDLIVTTPWLNRPVAVLLNDGHGNFTLRDPEAFSTAMWRFETSLYPASVEIRDLAAVFSRVPGDCALRERTLLALELPGRLVVEPSHAFNSSPAVSFLGRAPPVSVLHV